MPTHIRPHPWSMRSGSLLRGPKSPNTGPTGTPLGFAGRSPNLCRNRKQVIRRLSKGRATGQRAKVIELSVPGVAFLVGLLVDLGEGGGEVEVGVERWQIPTVGPQGTEDIRGFPDRPDAPARLDH